MKQLITILIAAIFGCIFYLVPLLPGDDVSWLFTYNGESHSTNRINTLSELIDSSLAHYNTINGRFLPHFLMRAVLMLPIWVNVLVKLLGIWLLFKYALLNAELGTNSNTYNASTKIAAAFVLLVLLNPEFGETFIWTSGYYNYGLPISMGLLLLYRLRSGIHHWAWLYVVLPLIALYIGNSTENTAVALGFCLGLWGIIRYLKSREIIHFLRSLPTLMLLATGILITYFAPGNEIKASAFQNYSIADFLTRTGGYLIVYFGGLWLVLLILKVSFARELSIKNFLKTWLRGDSWIIVLAALISLLVMYMAGGRYPTRVIIPAYVLLSLSVLRLLFKLNPPFLLQRVMSSKWGNIVLLLPIIFFGFVTISYYSILNHEHNLRISKRSKHEISQFTLIGKGPYFFVRDFKVRDSQKTFIHSMYNTYYGSDTLILKSAREDLR